MRYRPGSQSRARGVLGVHRDQLAGPRDRDQGVEQVLVLALTAEVRRLSTQLLLRAM